MDTNTSPRFMLFLLFLCLFLRPNLSLGGDTISENQPLSGDQTIVSTGGVFVLGFFKPGNSTNYYIGMWYKQVTERTVVWVANREKPVFDRFSSELKISDGNLVLFNESKFPIWSTNVNSSSSASVEAVLLDSGNLVLNVGSNVSEPLWQSFDHLTDTMLPNCRCGYNKKTKRNQVLTSWKNQEDPAPGLFSIVLEPSQSTFVIQWNKSKNYWNTGAWNGHIFTSVPEMSVPDMYRFNYTTDDSGSYFIYWVENSTKLDIFSRLMMDVSGQLKFPMSVPPTGWSVLWSYPRQQCQVYALCGSYGICTENSMPFCNCLWGFEPKSQRDWDLKDYSEGCVRKTRLQCENFNVSNSESDRFLELHSMSLPEGAKSTRPLGNSTTCESACLNDCSCTAFAFVSNGCSIWTGHLLDLQQLPVGDKSGRTLYIRLAASEFRSAKNSKGLIIGAAAGSAAVAILLLGLVLFLVIRQRSKTVRRGKAVDGSLTVFSYNELQIATKNFSEKLGEGGFGAVFKGTLSASTMIAVKKLESAVQGEKQFRAEVSTIGTIQHVNLVRLRGFCSQGTKKLLVYDYMANGSLASHLFEQSDLNVLDWKTRYQIAIGTARGIAYLHEKCRERIIHCDIKPENVLLDPEFCPKVADFGLAKLVGREFSRVLTTIRGTRGYLAPEWIAGVAITSKADVYSFGMMLFELVSGRRNSGQTEATEKIKYFPSMATSVLVGGGDVLDLLDERLQGNADVEEVKRLCKVACWCVQCDEAHRPTMGHVVQILEGVVEVNVPPVPRLLQFFDDGEENVIFFAG